MNISDFLFFVLTFTEINCLLCRIPQVMLVIFIHLVEEYLSENFLGFLLIIHHLWLFIIVISLDICEYNQRILLDWIVQTLNQLVEINTFGHELEHFFTIVVVGL